MLRPTMRQFLKFMHVIGAVSVTGGLAAFMLILNHGPGPDALDAYATVRRSAALVSAWIIVPGVALTAISALLAIATHRPFRRARWVWAKAATAIAVLALTLASVDMTARSAATTAAMAAGGELGTDELRASIRDPWPAWWLLLGLVGSNVVLAVWRPRLGQRGVL